MPAPAHGLLGARMDVCAFVGIAPRGPAWVPYSDDEWLEAKYYQLACLEKIDRPTAEKVLKQLKVLFPEIKSATWRDKFTELEKQLQ